MPSAHSSLKKAPPPRRSRSPLEHQKRRDVTSAREILDIRIEEDPTGACPAPVQSFEELGVLPSFVLKALKENGIARPMPVQAQALPLVLSGQDVIGIAQTGSGKTLAFLLPAIAHVEAQMHLKRGEVTPIAMVLAPTRELAVQISEEASKVLRHSAAGKHPGGLGAVCVYGGGDKRRQLEQLRRGAHIIAATPGRLIDFIKAGSIKMERVTYFVLDEADRMLEYGFQDDVMGIAGQIRPDRQMLFFSATWAPSVQKLALGLCRDGVKPVRISCGRKPAACGGDVDDSSQQLARESIDQEVVVVDFPGDWEKQAAEKRRLLELHLRKVLGASQEHKVLVFVSQKNLADDLARQLKAEGFEADRMHGGQAQEYRLWVLDEFRRGALRLLVCTDVLGRGIDIPSVSHVVIHEMGAIEEYVHRIGRTARGKDARGHALVFFEYWEKYPEVASQLVAVLRASKQPVPQALQQLADDVASGKRKASWGGNKRAWGA